MYKPVCKVALNGQQTGEALAAFENLIPTEASFCHFCGQKLNEAAVCPHCSEKLVAGTKFCGSCGTKLQEDRVKPDAHGRIKLHADIAHPINASCRRNIQETIIKAFHEELERSKQPDYKPVELDDDALSHDDH